ncbi:hypothetical protein A8C32_10620 [Flavivirga aquatica]|uniref:BIG2 domain-containing protein n=1 Tax=Flavivirga aquatica TaxID=1849968 RepID=A0A1E5TCT1_9FLAO|nr:Ig-like domain-containing protein [Flavivirga aquatica]OEK09176.1 hypothetical protein A8C32_10620 [Flavivirga aquatica]
MKTIKIKCLLAFLIIACYGYSSTKTSKLIKDFFPNSSLTIFQGRAVADVGITSIPSTMILGTPSARGKVTYEVIPSDATDKTVSITSSNTSVATVNKNGVIRAKSVGSTVIFVTTNDGGLEVRATIHVLAAPSTFQGRAVADVGITSIPSTMILGTPSARGKVTYEVIPSDATDKTVSITSSNSNVATVNQNGLIVAKSVGSTEISIITNDGGLEVRSTIYVLAGNSSGGGENCSASKWENNTTYKQKKVVSLNGKIWRWKPKKEGNCKPGNCKKWKDLGNCSARNSKTELNSTSLNFLSTAKVSPNPLSSGNDLNISLSEIKNVVNITIIDLNGRVVLDEKFKTNNIILNTTHFSKGLYLMRIENGSQFLTKKLLVL